MVERKYQQNYKLDAIFTSLSHPTRRDILRRVSKHSMSISDIAAPYKMSFAAVAKHLDVLEGAQLITKKRYKKEQLVTFSIRSLAEATNYLHNFEKLWKARVNSLDRYLKTINSSPTTLKRGRA